MKKVSKIVSSLVLGFFLLSCEGNQVEDVILPMPNDYIALSVGDYRIYKVDSLFIDSLAGVRNRTVFYQKEVADALLTTALESEFTNIRINTFVSSSINGPWRIQRVGSHSFNTERLERQENNERFIRFQSPILESTRWDQNALNTRRREISRFIQIEEPYDTFPKTITVEQLNNFNLIRIERAKEVYAPNLGLVFKQLDTLNTFLNPNPSLNPNPPVRTGVRYSKVLVAYGRE
ncbi:MAG: hypothetical protein ACXITV_00930 [Luteibaculaceae bacterium]